MTLVDHVRLVARLVVEVNGRRRPAELLALSLATTVLEGLALLLVLPAVSTLDSGSTYAVPGTGLRVGTLVIAAAIVVVVALRAAVTWLGTMLGHDLQLRTAERMRLRALDAILHARWSYLLGQRRSVWVQSLTTEVQRASAAIDVLFQIVVTLILVVVLSAVALVVAPFVALAAIVLVGLLVLVVRHDITRMMSLGMDLSESLERFGAVVTDSLASVRVVRSHDAATTWIDSLTVEARRGRVATLDVVRRTTRTSVALAAAGVLGLLGLAFVGTRSGVPGPQLIALVLTTTRLLGSARALVSLAQQFAYLAPALSHVDEQTREAEAAREQAVGSRSPGPRTARRPAALRLEAVTVAYEGAEAPALHDVSFTVPAGRLTTLSGPSGSGKSTALDVVLGLLSPDAGRLLVDDAPLADVAGWRARLAYVPQETLLVPGTVRHNLLWSTPGGAGHGTDDALWAALDAAALADVVRRLPGGLDTELRESAQLSGGERQRLCLARALVRRPDLLVLDEATSALDPATEERLLDAIAFLGCTVLMATHRPAVVARAATAVVLDAGRVVPPGAQPVK